MENTEQRFDNRRTHGSEPVAWRATFEIPTVERVTEENQQRPSETQEHSSTEQCKNFVRCANQM